MICVENSAHSGQEERRFGCKQISGKIHRWSFGLMCPPDQASSLCIEWLKSIELYRPGRTKMVSQCFTCHVFFIYPLVNKLVDPENPNF